MKKQDNQSTDRASDLSAASGSLYDTPARRLRVDIEEGTIYHNMTTHGADVSRSMKSDLLAVLDRLEELENGELTHD